KGQIAPGEEKVDAKLAHPNARYANSVKLKNSAATGANFSLLNKKKSKPITETERASISLSS
ncbi:TPA: hypothetical protein ACQQ5M_005910, partial [Pseudomonas aeruginosa]